MPRASLRRRVRGGRRGAHFPRHAAVLDDVDSFDAGFFRIYPREAGLLDPHRLALEPVWITLEDSGYRPADLPVNTGVFLGVSGNEPRGRGRRGRRAAVRVPAGRLRPGARRARAPNGAPRPSAGCGRERPGVGFEAAGEMPAILDCNQDLWSEPADPRQSPAVPG
ncbi:beta-ketoacyl synthase N-terminal-like domain-containing protein [Streptomyces sp. NPDC055013]